MLTDVKNADFRHGPLKSLAVELLDRAPFEKFPLEIIKGRSMTLFLFLHLIFTSLSDY